MSGDTPAESEAADTAASHDATDAPRGGGRFGGGRRRVFVAALLLLVGAGCLWGSSRATWVHYTSFDELQPPRDAGITGAHWAGELVPLALVLLAAIAAAFAVKGWALRLVGLVVAAVGVATAVRAISALSSPSTARVADVAGLPARATVTSAEAAVGPAVVALVGAVCAVLAGIQLLRPAPREAAAGLSSKYQTPGAVREEAARRADRARDAAASGAGKPVDEELTERMLWDALDAGEDPTTGVEPADPSGPHERDSRPDDGEGRPQSGPGTR